MSSGIQLKFMKFWIPRGFGMRWRKKTKRLFNHIVAYDFPSLEKLMNVLVRSDLKLKGGMNPKENFHIIVYLNQRYRQR